MKWRKAVNYWERKQKNEKDKGLITEDQKTAAIIIGVLIATPFVLLKVAIERVLRNDEG